MRQPQLRAKKLAKKKRLRKKYEKVRNMFPVSGANRPKIRKVGDQYQMKRRPTYPQFLPPSKKVTLNKEQKAALEKKKKFVQDVAKIATKHPVQKPSNDKLDNPAG